MDRASRGGLRVYTAPRVAIQLPLGFASGLPYLLTGTTLGTWLTVQGTDLGTVGLFAWVALPYSLKFLWAPVLDRFQLPLLGRRRGWLLALQLVVAAAIAAVGAVDPRADLGRLAVLSTLLAFSSATLDIVVDAFRADTLLPDERAAGSALYVLGYRLGMLLAGAGALVLADRLPWRTVYLLMAAVAAVTVLATLVAPEPTVARPPRTLAAAIRAPLRDLAGRPGVAAALAFVVLYRLGGLLLDQMKQPFLVQLGFGPGEIGAVNKGIGLGAMVAGGLCAGALVPRLGVRRALLGFGAVAALVHLAFAVLAVHGKDHALFVGCVVVDSFGTGLAVTPFDAFLMAQCRRDFSATQYAILTSLAGAGARLVGGAAGVVAAAAGWPLYFAATFVVSLPALALVRRLPDPAGR
jgi:PAT family beta-lactamase induction signal transducer AmpG